MKTFMIAVVLPALLAVDVLPAEYNVDKNKGNLVKFISEAPMETITGVTDKIDGYVVWNGEDPLKDSELLFQVDLNGLDTGIGLRNRHMRENYLETDQFPMARFSGKAVRFEKTADGGSYEVSVEGSMTIHGVEKAMTIDGQVKNEDGLYLATCSFQVSLSDYGIKIPKLMFMKLNEIIKIELSFYLKEIINR